MGGMVAQQLGARYAHKVRSLSICNSASEMPPRSLWDHRLAVAAKDGIGALVEGTIKRWFTPAFVARAPQEIAKVRAFIEQTQAPVSYTHLDVYKRQLAMPSTGASAREVVDFYGLDIGSHPAVSYTHLDVYKRQIQRFTPAISAAKLQRRK